METKENVKFKITLTSEEFEILKEFSRLQGKPMASCFMTFVRDANLFKVIGGANKAMNSIVKLKSSLRKNVEGIPDEFSVTE